MKNIDAAYVVGLHRYNLHLAEERGLRQFIATTRRLVDMKHRVNIPKEYRAIAQEVRTPYMRDTAFRVTSSLTKEDPLLTYKPRDSEDDDSKQAAAIGAAWTAGQFEDMKRLGKRDFVYHSALHLVRDSESVLKLVHRPDAWANFPVRDEDEDAKKYVRRAETYAKTGGVYAPFACRVVDRTQMLFGDGEYGDEWCIEYGEYPLPYLDRRFSPTSEAEPTPETKLGGPPSAGAPGYAGASGDVSLPTLTSGIAGRTIKMEYFDKDTWHVVINGHDAPGFPKPNPYAPYLPYIRAVSYPALYALRYLVPALDALLTMKMNWAYLSAFPVVVMEPMAGVQQMLDSLPAGDPGDPPASMTWKPGKVYFPPSGYTMKFLEPPKTGADVDTMIQELGELINIAGIPNVFRGIGGARQPGYSINQLMAAAQLTYRQLGTALEHQLEDAALLMLHMTKVISGEDNAVPIYVMGQVGDSKQYVGLKAKGGLQKQVAPIDLLGPPKCTFRPVLPTDEQSEAMIGMQLLNAPRQVRPHEIILAKYFQSENPAQELDDIAVEKSLELLMPEVIEDAKRIAGLLPAQATSEAPPGTIGAVKAAEPNDQTNAGQPTVPLLTQAAGAGQPTPGPITMPEPTGGRAAGEFPAAPAGQGR